MIFQVTLGCSWNRCAFCEMYTSKSFRVRSESEVLEEIQQTAQRMPQINRIFLADGNAMVLKTDRLLRTLAQLYENFPQLRRVTSYALPADLERKTESELSELQEAGLKMVYVGLESGDDEVLKRVGKGETAKSSLVGCEKARSAGISLSVMILNGLGGKELSRQHAEGSAKLVNAIQPEFLSTLVLSFPYGLDHFRKRLSHPFEPLQTEQLIEEMGVFLAGIQLEKTVFRSDHASNYLVLKGTLNKDKEALLAMINRALAQPEKVALREEWQRGL